MPTLRTFALPLLALAFCLPACAADVENDEAGDTATASEALTSCGAARYDAALAHYTNAVAWSKDRLAKGVCQSENGLLWSIADEASRAVTTCSAFRTTLRTSPWAAPLRTALAPSLTLESLTGELLVIKDSAWQNWTGAERFFDRGVSFWARAEGAYGPEAGPRTVTVTRAGKTESFTLGVQDGAAWSDAPLFVLTPRGTAPALFSLVSECDA